MDSKLSNKIIGLNQNIQKALDTVDKIPGPIGLAMKAVIIKTMTMEFISKNKRGVIEPGEMILPIKANNNINGDNN